MKHATSRFFRFFLVAALVAAMVGSLLPAKVAGQATNVTVTPTSYVAGQPTGFTVTFTTDVELKLDDDDDDTNGILGTPIAISITGAGITFGAAPGTGTAANHSPGSLVTVEGEDVVAAAGLTFTDGVTVNSPVAADVGDSVTVVIASHYANDEDTTEDESTTAIATNATAAGVVNVTVTAGTGGTASTPATTYNTYILPTLTGLNTTDGIRAGQVARWDVMSQNVGRSVVTKDQHEITVTFSAGTSVPSSIDKNSIRLISSAGPGATPTLAGSPALNPSVSGRVIRFVSPVDVTSAADSTLRVIISEDAGIAAPSMPSPAGGGMTVTVQAGAGNTAATSTAIPVKAYLNISPRIGPRGTTVTVTGAGFTPGTSGKVMVGGSNAGDYTVDSGGKLTGSFVATSSTSDGGPVSVLDQGRNAEVTGQRWMQSPSATPADTNVTRGSSVNVTLSDFPGSGNYTATIGGKTGDYFTTTSNTKGSLNVPQDEGTGTKQVVISRAGGEASFLITIGGRTLVVSPSSAVPGQAVTVSGSGFNGIATVDLMLTGVVQPKLDAEGNQEMDAEGNVVMEQVPVDNGNDIKVNTDGTFLYTGRVPFTEENTGHGVKTWTATGYTNPGTSTVPASGKRSASSSGFTIQKRAITLSPSTANPGATVDVFGSGWGVKTQGNATSQVTLEIDVTGTNPRFGPFPISSTGEFSGAVTVPSDTGVISLTVIATDNNGTNALDATLTQGFADNQTAQATLRVPQGVISVSPSTASTGSVITVTGQGFPAQTNLSALSFGDGNALPVPAPATDVNGNFTVTLTVPAAAQGGSLPPGAVVITARVGQISGTTSFTIPGPSITLSTSSAAPGQMITVSGTNFGAYANVGLINVGQQNQAPTPNPLTDGVGNFSAQVLIPALNPGAYTITVRTAAAFTATASINIVSQTAEGVSPEQAFQALTSRGILTLAAAAAPGGTSFGAYVPDLAGNTLVQVEPNGVLILTLNTSARISVSNQPAVDVAADTPTFFALGSVVSVEVIE